MPHSQRSQAEALFLEGNRLLSAGDLSGAEAAFKQALVFIPDFIEAHANLGLIYNLLGSTQDAERHYRQAIVLAPHVAQIHLNFGAFLAKVKRFDEAEAAYRQAIALQPDYAAAWSNLGALLAGLNRDEEAEQCHRTALAIAPDYDKARFNLAYVLLRQGRFEEGWACFEARDWHAPLDAYLTCPRWQGESLVGKKLLVGYEGGFGDVLQFCRYIPLIKRLSTAEITLFCHPQLKSLLATLEGVDAVVGYDEALPSDGWNAWLPLLSAPFVFGTRVDNIPAALPYLKAEPERMQHWAPRLPKTGFRVGLVWKGSADHDNDADRSLPSLASLSPLADIPGIQFIGLQKGPGEEETQIGPHTVMPLGRNIQDFADTAAILAQLDLLISIDSAPAHLAGAMGVPCWVLLPDYQTDWRWLKTGETSPWYPGILRLFRQKRMGDWESVIAEVAAALAAFTPHKTAIASL
jgi:Tfp pilus assembly protein PilF